MENIDNIFTRSNEEGQPSGESGMEALAESQINDLLSCFGNDPEKFLVLENINIEAVNSCLSTIESLGLKGMALNIASERYMQTGANIYEIIKDILAGKMEVTKSDLEKAIETPVEMN